MKRMAMVALAFFVVGCTKEDKGGQDHTVARLQQLQQQAAATKPAPPVDTAAGPESNGKLAQQVADGGSLESEIPVTHDAQARAGMLGITLVKLASMHSVSSSSRVRLTTNDFFLRVDLAVVNNGEQPIAVNWAAAKIQKDQSEWSVAPDAQRAGGSHDLSTPLRSGEKRDVALYFEVPENGWTHASLVLPAGSGADGELRAPF